MPTPAPMSTNLECFLKPLHIDVAKAHLLAHELHRAYQHLAAESLTQFLPTPISEGGTNLRAGFIELLGSESAPLSDKITAEGHHSDDRTASNLSRVLERAWPIEESLKNGNPDSLFAWIGSCIAQVVREGIELFNLERDSELPMGVAFSFPVVQHTLSKATIMAMGKGFAVESKLDLGALLENGYEKSRSPDLPRIKVTAILNDSVATLVTFIYQFQEDDRHKAAMAFICGTGTNATVPLRQSIFNPAKLPGKITVRAEDQVDDVKVAVNTEWSIKGSVEPLHKLGLVTKWDVQLDAEGEAPGFQPFEYMTSGRYLGELARLVFLDYIQNHIDVSERDLPPQLLHRFGLTTTFLSHYQPPHPPTLLRKLQGEFPSPTTATASSHLLPFAWTEEIAVTLYHIAKTIEIRAAAFVAAAIIGLLACADDIPLPKTQADEANQRPMTKDADKMNLVVGYTGGCIVHFQDYLSDCQSFLDSIIDAEFGDHSPVKLTLSPCHDGGIIGAGVLCGASQTKSKDVGMAYEGRQDAEASNRDDQPDEHTALLGAGQHAQYRTGSASDDESNDDRHGDNTDEYDALDQEFLAIRSRIESFSDNPPAPAPGPIKPAPASHHNSEAEDANGTSDNDNDNNSDEPPPRDFLINTHPGRFRIVFAGIMMTYFIANFDSTIMASSHPVITSYFGASHAASWLTTAFLLTSTAFQPLVGRLSDATGRKPLYLLTMLVFAAATVWCALAGSIASFVAARAVCGLGAGGMMTLGAISISDCVPIQQRGFYQSLINVTYGIAASSGAAFGGFLADTLGWRWEFGIQLAPLAVCMATAAIGMPADLGLQKQEDGETRQTLVQALRGFDFKGSALLTTSTTFLILGLNLGGNILPWSHPFIIASLIVFAVCFPICLYVESRVERPIMPLVLLRSSPRANIIFSNTIASFLLNAILFNVPLFFRAVLLKTATQSGLYLIVPTATASITGTITGVFISRNWYLKYPLVGGTIFFFLGTILLSISCSSIFIWPTWAYLISLAPAAVGQGLQYPSTFIAVLAASAHKDQAVVTSTLQLWRALGNVLGVACSSLVFQNALLRYLETYVTVPEGRGGESGEWWKRQFIERIRSNIEDVARLPEGQAKQEVIRSYAAACRDTFLVCVGIALVSVLLVLPIKLPRLGRTKPRNTR
ncbi:MFS general substrate transporter [Astrocystis sublimbata]|nr:MFS general substrate transporter [Astrocystis sublimbata]